MAEHSYQFMDYFIQTLSVIITYCSIKHSISFKDHA